MPEAKPSPLPAQKVEAVVALRFASCRKRRTAVPARVCSIAWICFACACRPEPDQPSPAPENAPAEQKRADLLVFPDELRVEDASVNEFIEHAMNECASGDYDRFRLLWSARDEPLPQDEYEQGWQAVQRINVRAVEKVKLRGKSQLESGRSETVYAVLADVSLDPAHPAGRGEPTRHVVLMVTREHDRWWLARAPKSVRTWITKHVRPDETTVSSAEDRPVGGDGRQ